jgi:hypothetical protein
VKEDHIVGPVEAVENTGTLKFKLLVCDKEWILSSLYLMVKEQMVYGSIYLIIDILNNIVVTVVGPV